MIRTLPSPPRFALRLVRLMTDRDEPSGAAGDLEERYADLLKMRGVRRARLDCWRQVLAIAPGFFHNLLYWSFQMLKNYLKIAFRVLRKHKGYSAINMVGLAVGMACALLILLWVQDELSFDRFHANAAALYRVEQDQRGGQGIFHVFVTPYGMAPELKAQIPEIKDSTRYSGIGTVLVRFGEKAFFENRIRAVDPSFLRMFTFPATKGRTEKALDSPNSIILTETLAEKYFGGENPIGKTVTINNASSVVVTAVLKDPPDNTVLRFEGLLPSEFLKTQGADLNDWSSNRIITMIQLHDRSAAAAVGEKITQLVQARTIQAIRSDPVEWKRIQSDPEAKRRFDSYRVPNYSLMPVVDINLYGYFGFNRSNQGIRTVTTFSVIALFVLLIACINFMNLATARSANRAREVGLRKVVGAFRKTIAGQFYGESVLISVLSGLAAMGLVILLLPAFNSLSDKHITAAALLDWKYLLGILAVIGFTGFVAGSYPALFLSSFHPVKVLKGRLVGARGALFRKILVVLQFGLSILLLIGMGVVFRQIETMRAKKLGYEKDQLIYLPLRGDTARTYPALKERLLRNPEVEGVTSTHQLPTQIGSNSWNADWDGKDPNQNYIIGIAFVDFDYTETMKISLAAGRPFHKKYSMDAGASFLVNEEVPKLMGLDPGTAIGRRFRFSGVDGTIIGVMKNFHYQSVRAAIEPLAVRVAPENAGFAVIRLKAGDIPGSLDAVKAGWQDINPQYPFDYRFFDQDFDQMYRADERMGSVLRVFAAMAVLIACLGLFGLASFMAEQRTPEIGVRKVLGASARGIVVLLSKEFAKWVVVANLLAWPAAYFIMRDWLKGYAFKTTIPPWLFLSTGAATLAVALLTVGFQAFRAARTDPARALKFE